jgi:hypothetical protein
MQEETGCARNIARPATSPGGGTTGRLAWPYPPRVAGEMIPGKPTVIEHGGDVLPLPERHTVNVGNGTTMVSLNTPPQGSSFNLNTSLHGSSFELRDIDGQDNFVDKRVSASSTGMPPTGIEPAHAV